VRSVVDAINSGASLVDIRSSYSGSFDAIDAAISLMTKLGILPEELNDTTTIRWPNTNYGALCGNLVSLMDSQISWIDQLFVPQNAPFRIL
jgi:hypothetical protein